jgi:glycosyltransferase involved in cell wall biosynthesis
LNNKPLITKITPTFNSEKTILDNINSISDQKFENWEHILIDNLSSDKTILRTFNDLKKNFKKVRH